MGRMLLLFVLCASAFAQLKFNNANTDVVTFPNTGTDPTTGTFYAWIYPTSYVTGRRVFAKNAVGGTGFWTFNFPGAGTNRLRISVDYTTTDADAQSVDNVFTLNTWNFVAAVFTAGSAPKLYVGTLTTDAAEITYTGTPAVNSGTRVTDGGSSEFVGNQNAGTASFPGIIDIVNWIPGTALSGAQLIAHQKLPVADANSKIFLGLGRGNGTGSQIDKSGAGNNGTVSGATLAAGTVPIGVPAII